MMGTEDAFTHLDAVVMDTFGSEYTLVRNGGVASTIAGVLIRDVQPTGAYDAVMQSQVTLTVTSDVLLQRNDRISTPQENWRVDRKLKDDGRLARWSLHAD